jgi:hypothetical protein
LKGINFQEKNSKPRNLCLSGGGAGEILQNNFPKSFQQYDLLSMKVAETASRNVAQIFGLGETKGKVANFNNDDVCLPFFLLFILWLTGRRFHLSGSQPVSVFA